MNMDADRCQAAARAARLAGRKVLDGGGEGTAACMIVSLPSDLLGTVAGFLCWHDWFRLFCAIKETHTHTELVHALKALVAVGADNLKSDLHRISVLGRAVAVIEVVPIDSQLI